MDFGWLDKFASSKHLAQVKSVSSDGARLESRGCANQYVNIVSPYA